MNTEQYIYIYTYILRIPSGYFLSSSVMFWQTHMYPPSCFSFNFFARFGHDFNNFNQLFGESTGNLRALRKSNVAMENPDL